MCLVHLKSLIYLLEKQRRSLFFQLLVHFKEKLSQQLSNTYPKYNLSPTF